MNFIRRCSLLLALIFFVGCAVDTHLPGNVEVKVALDESGLEIVDSKEVYELENEVAEGDAVHFTFVPAGDGETVTGSLKDDRKLRTEFDLNGEVDPLDVTATTGLFEVRIPNLAGTLTFESADGTTLGSVEFDPDAPVTHQMELMRQSDILSGPTKIVNNGEASRKVDLLFVPEGYTERDMRNFHRHVDTIVSQLSNYRGFRQYWGGFNVWRQDIRSRSNVIGSNARPHDTAFETASGISGVDRCVFFSNSRGRQAAQSLGRNVGAEVTIVLVNSTSHGGCAGDGLIVSARPRNVSDVIAHELGHALFDLADEYETARPGGHCSTGPNVSSSPQRLPWSDLVNTNQLPTPPNASFGTIGAFEGAGYCSQGRYRPTHNCMMRSLGVAMCPVCRREVARKMSRYDLNRDPTGPTQPSDGGGSTSGAGSNSGPTVSTPSGLQPDFAVVDEPEIDLRWSATPGAEYYNFEVQVERSGSWRDYAEQQVSSTRVRVPLNYATDYRWRVTACNSSGCLTSIWARFTYDDGSSGGTTDGGGGGTTNDPPASGVPARPSVIAPTPQSVVRSSQTRIDWGSSSGATHYNLILQIYNANNQSWSRGLEQERITNSHLTVGQLVDGVYYAWSVQACNSRGCSNWTDPAVFQIRL